MAGDLAAWIPLGSTRTGTLLITSPHGGTCASARHGSKYSGSGERSRNRRAVWPLGPPHHEHPDQPETADPPECSTNSFLLHCSASPGTQPGTDGMRVMSTPQ